MTVRPATYRTVDCQTCGHQGTVWWCQFCEDHYCIECPKGARIEQTDYCDQECQDAREVVKALMYTGPRCAVCDRRSDSAIGRTKFCSTQCSNVWWKKLAAEAVPK